MKKLSYDMPALEPSGAIHLERIGKFVPTKTGDAIVVDLVPSQIVVFIHPLGPAAQACMVSLDAGTSTVFAEVAECNGGRLKWAFLALTESVQKNIRSID